MGRSQDAYPYAIYFAFGIANPALFIIKNAALRQHVSKWKIAQAVLGKLRDIGITSMRPASIQEIMVCLRTDPGFGLLVSGGFPELQISSGLSPSSSDLDRFYVNTFTVLDEFRCYELRSIVRFYGDRVTMSTPDSLQTIYHLFRCSGP